MYRMHRICCVLPSNLSEERRVFRDTIGQFNEAEAMNAGVLFVPISVVDDPAGDAYQAAVPENIQACLYYIHVAAGQTEDLGKNYQFALRCKSDPVLPLRDVVLLRKDSDFVEADQLKPQLSRLFSKWLAEL